MIRQWLSPQPPPPPPPGGPDPEGPPIASVRHEIGPPPPAEDELRWARRETELIVRRARALDIDVDLERSIR